MTWEMKTEVTKPTTSNTSSMVFASLTPSNIRQPSYLVWGNPGYMKNNLVLHTIGLRALDGATEHRPGLVTLAPAIEYAGRLILESWRLI